MHMLTILGLVGNIFLILVSPQGLIMLVLTILGLFGNILLILDHPQGLPMPVLTILGLVGNILSLLVPPGSPNSGVTNPGSCGEYPLHTSPPRVF